MATDFARVPVTIVEIDQDRCTRVYGAAPCTAAIGVTGTQRCWNTLRTCQDTTNYATAPLTLRFATDGARLPNDVYIIPSLQSVDTSPTEINIGGRQGASKPLGVRAQVKCSFVDHPHGDNIVDPYVTTRAYDPLKQGTFWGKWMARNPYHQNRALRVLTGYEGQALSAMTKREYRIKSISGPDSKGNVTVTADDILRLADNDRATAPKLSNGQLSADLTNIATSLIVVGGLLADYAGSNAVRIGREVMLYTTSALDSVTGNITLSGLTRGQEGTVAATAKMNDTVQGCLRFASVVPWQVARDLLINFALVPTAFIDYAAWEAEANEWLTGFTVTRLITEPQGVTTLLGELCEQCLFYIWWDDRTQNIRFRAVRPIIGGDVPVVTEAGNLLKDETYVTVKPELRATEVWVNILPMSVTETKNERNAFRITRARVNADAMSANQYGDRRSYEVFSRWLESGLQADMLANRLLGRYASAGVGVKFVMDAKDRGYIGLGDVFDLQYSGFTDETGAAALVRYQVISEHDDDDRIVIDAQKFDFGIGARYGRWMVDSAPTYELASVNERANGFFWSNVSGKMSDSTTGYLWS